MPAKHFDLSLDQLLGGDSASDYYIPSQKAIKNYVDNSIDQVSTVSTLQHLQDVNISNPTNLQVLSYDTTTQKWKNNDFTVTWGSITGTIDLQTDLQTILDSKANVEDVPTVSDIYDENSSNAMSGKAVASAINNLSNTSIIFRSW